MVKYMNKRISVLWSIITCVGLLFFVTNTTQAQGLGDLDQLFSANAADVETLTKAYLNPLATGFSTAINSGWVTKAKPTKKLGFSVQLRAGFTSIPSSAQTFDVNNLDLTGNYRIEGNTSYTINGDEKSGQQLFPIVDGVESPTPITMPKGTGFNGVPAPMLQANVGLIKDTELTARYIPVTNIGDFGDLSLTGIGIKHGLNQWLPGGKLLPIDISIMAAYTTLSLNADINSNQSVETTTDGFVLNALVGKTLPFLSAYGGIGFQTGSFALDIEQGGLLSESISYTQDSDAAIHAMAGFQLKIAILRIYVEATMAEYATVNAGIGIGLRN